MGILSLSSKYSVMTFGAKEVAVELLPILQLYKDGSVERLIGSPYVPPSLKDPTTAFSSKDINISPHVSARLYLLNLAATAAQKLPILVYFHSGGFCVESAFSLLQNHYITALVSESKAITISIENRLAPENPFPAAYEDSWAALKWVASHSDDSIDQSTVKEPWIVEHDDFNQLFIGGDSVGANIAHNIAMRAGIEAVHGGVKILGDIVSHPYFLGSKRIGSEPNLDLEQNFLYKMWMFAYPSAPGGIDNPMINPFTDDAPSLSGLGCSLLLVCVAEKDELRERGVWYFEEVKRNGWRGDGAELFEVEGEGHGFYLLLMS